MNIRVDIQPTDYRHVDHYDETCSRCRRKIREEEVPLLFWDQEDTNKMWSYCENCSNDLFKED